MGYVRLRDFNLRVAGDGVLVPISSDRPVPIELPALMSPPLDHQWPPQPPQDLAEGTVDGLDPHPPVRAPVGWIENKTEQLYSQPLPPPAPFEDTESDELPYRPWTEDDVE